MGTTLKRKNKRINTIPIDVIKTFRLWWGLLIIILVPHSPRYPKLHGRHRVHSFEMIQIRIGNPRSVGSSQVKSIFI